ncbi:hypothetical protein ACFE04_029161 [Oxalis oulophora]
MKKRIKTMKTRNMKVDRLSDLSDDLILHILSYAYIDSTKRAVMTCVLSKRWRHIWEYLPSLSMYDNPCLSNHSISQLLEKHKAYTLYDLKLYYKPEFVELSVVKRFLEHAVSSHVRHLVLKSNWNSTYNSIASCLLSSKTLTSLKMEYYILCVDTPSCFNFPSLKTLRLSNILFRRPSNITTPVDLFSNCVSLENLELNQCMVMCSSDFIISCPQLLNLQILINSTPPTRNHWNIIISAPRLTSLKFEDKTNMNYVLSIGYSPRLHAVHFHTNYRDENNA